MPQNGAGEATGAPAATSQTSGAPTAPAPNYQELHAKTARDLEETRATLKRMESERAAEKAETAKREKAREALEQERTRNPSKHLRELYGEGWYDVVTKAKAGTVAPEHVSAALDEREKALRSYVDDVVKPLKEENARLRADADERVREKHAARAAAFVKENPTKFDLLNRYKQSESLGAFIEGHHSMTGELWTLEQGAAALEKYWADVRDMVLKSENGRTLGDALGTAPSPMMGKPRVEESKDETDAQRAERRKRASLAWLAWAKPQGTQAN